MRSPSLSPPSLRLLALGWQRFRAQLPSVFLIMALTGLPALLLQVGLPGLMRGRIGIAGPASSTIGAGLLIALSLVGCATGSALLLPLLAPSPTPSERRPWRAVVPDLSRLLTAALVASLLITVGLFLGVVPGVIALTWWAFVPQVVVIEHRSGTTALRRSRQLATGVWRQVTLVLALATCAGLCVQSLMWLFAVLLPGIEAAGAGSDRVWVLHYPNYVAQAVLTHALMSLVQGCAVCCLMLLYAQGAHDLTAEQEDKMGQDGHREALPL